jgi:hypothetical protein
MHTDIHALSGISTNDPSVRASEGSSCLRPRGHCDRRSKINTIKEHTETVTDISVEVGLEVYTEKAKYMLMSRSRNIKIAKRSFENVAKFKYLGKTVKNQNLIWEEIKS